MIVTFRHITTKDLSKKDNELLKENDGKAYDSLAGFIKSLSFAERRAVYDLIGDKYLEEDAYSVVFDLYGEEFADTLSAAKYDRIIERFKEEEDMSIPDRTTWENAAKEVLDV